MLGISALGQLPLAGFPGRYSGIPGLVPLGLVTNPRAIVVGQPTLQPNGSFTKRRVVVIVPKSPNPSMPYGNDLSPIDALLEKVTITFDFAPWLKSGVTVSAVTSVLATVAGESSTPDPNPQNIVTGSAQIGPSPTTGAANTAVLQQVANCQSGVVYLLQCLVQTSDSQILNLGSHLTSVTLQ